MLSKVISLFFIFSFLTGVLSESQIQESFELSNQYSLENNYSDVNSSKLLDKDSESCNEDECSEHGRHCMHHCAGIHSILSMLSESSVVLPCVSRLKKIWPMSRRLKPPFLAPKIIPPILS